MRAGAFRERAQSPNFVKGLPIKVALLHKKIAVAANAFIDTAEAINFSSRC